MASHKRGRVSLASLPTELQLDILARLDVQSVLRCAATCKAFRRAVLHDPPALCGPGQLVGVSYTGQDALRPPALRRVVDTTASSRVRVLSDLSFVPVASRDGLLVLRRLDRATAEVQLFVCNTFTGGVTSVAPAPEVDGLMHVLLDAGGDSFELLVADRSLRTQTFTSRDGGRWGPVRATSVVPANHLENERHLSFVEKCCQHELMRASRPAVVGRTVYWPCHLHRSQGITTCCGHILALGVDAAEATVVDLPPTCISRMPAFAANGNLLLASSRGQLRLFVVESMCVSMWMHTPAASGGWTRQVVTDTNAIHVQACWHTRTAFGLRGFGEHSGALILQALSGHQGNGLIRLDLAAARPPVVTTLAVRVHKIRDLYLHEIDLLSLLQNMKPL